VVVVGVKRRVKPVACGAVQCSALRSDGQDGLPSEFFADLNAIVYYFASSRLRL
jgi:hypothetical protein